MTLPEVGANYIAFRTAKELYPVSGTPVEERAEMISPHPTFLGSRINSDFTPDYGRALKTSCKDWKESEMAGDTLTRYEHSTFRQATTTDLDLGGRERLEQKQPRVRDLFMSALVFTTLLLLVTAFFSASAFGQGSNTGTVTGVVKDSAGRVVVTATLTLHSQGQGHSTVVKTNGQGEFVFNGVPVGTYSLTVKAPTFASYVVNDVKVDANVNANLDAVLAPGSSDTSVTVTSAESSTVETRSSTIGFTIDQNLVENLPLDGNNVIEVAAMLPGVTDLNAPTTFTNNTGGPTYNISGSRNNQNLLLLDGAVWNNLYNNSGLNFPPSQALAEVSVLTNGFKAQYGRNVGSVFNVVTKSGTSKYHGILYEIAQNQYLDATDYLTHLNPHLVQNQFGGQFGGPLLRDKLFFSIAYQDLRSSAAVIAAAQTLSASERGLNADGTPRPCVSAAFKGYNCASFTEDFSKANAAGVITPTGQLATDPFTNYVQGAGSCDGTVTSNAYINCTNAVSAVNAAWVQAGNIGTSPCPALLANSAANVTFSGGGTQANIGYLPNNEIPNVCFNPVSIRLLQYQPLPNTVQASDPLEKAVTQAKQPRNDQNGLIRIDYNLRSHTIDARYYQTAADDMTPNGVNQGVGIATYDIDHNVANLHFGGIGDTWVLTSSLLNVLRLDYKRYVYIVTPTDNTTLSDLGANYTQPGDNSLPQISLQSRNLNLGVTNNNNQSVDEDIEVDDSLLWTHGKHNYQFGAEFLRLQYLTNHTNEPSLGFGTNFTGNTSSDYILGLVASGTVQNATAQAAIQHDLYLYAQDDWRITSRLTLNLGIRYEIPFQWYQPDGQASTFIPGYRSSVFPTAPPNLAFVGDTGVERSLVGTTYHSIAPRFGFAYDVYGDGRTSLRGGFGVFYDAINALVVGISSPYHYMDNTTENPGGLSVPLLNLPAVPNNYVKGVPPPFVQPYSITFPDKNFTTPYTMSMNLSVQQRLSKVATLEMDYVGHLSRHLPLAMDLNPSIYDCTGAYAQLNITVYCNNAVASTLSYNQRAVYPGFNQAGGVLDYMTVGTGNYNALQVVFTMRSGRTLTTTASYTFSKSMDDQSATNITNASDGPNHNAHYAPSDFDARHILNVGFVLRYPDIHQGFRPLRAVINGWGLNGIFTGRTGHPFSAISQTDTTLRHEYNEYLSVNPLLGKAYIPLPSGRTRKQKVAQWFNTADVIVPQGTYTLGANSYTFPRGAFGNVQRNSLTAPAFMLTTLAVQRTFVVSKGKTFVFRLDAINAFNIPNLGNPSSSLSAGATANSTFGTILATAGGNNAVGTNGRRLQLSGTFRF
jgi:hypothetical protein